MAEIRHSTRYLFPVAAAEVESRQTDPMPQRALIAAPVAVAVAVRGTRRQVSPPVGALAHLSVALPAAGPVDPAEEGLAEGRTEMESMEPTPKKRGEAGPGRLRR